MDRLDLKQPDVALATSWVSGHADLNYALKFEGATPQDMADSVSGRVEYVINNGVSRSLLLDGDKPLKFQTLQGALEIDKQVLRVLPSKFSAENRIYDMSGTVSLVDMQTKLKLSNRSSHWEVSGALDKPIIAASPHIEATAARTQ